METLKFIMKRHGIDFYQELPIKLNGSRFKELPKLFRKLGFTKGVEIGVSRGFYSKCLMQYVPGLHLSLVDPWNAYEGYVEQHDENGQTTLDANLEKAKVRLADFNVEYIQKYSLDAVNDFEDESLDFVFIDGNHSFEYVVDDIAAWSKKVRKGGIVAGHDYWNSYGDEDRIYVKGLSEEEQIKLCQVKDAVDAYTKANRIKPWFVLNEDKSPTWFWVKA